MTRPVDEIGTQAPRSCPECQGSGRGPVRLFRGYGERIPITKRDCWACEGLGSLTRDQASRYYHESGYSDAEAERDLLERKDEDPEA